MGDLAVSLTRLVLGDPAVVRAEGRRAVDPEWTRTLVALAAAWRVVPQLRTQLRSAAVTLDQKAETALHTHSVAAAAQSTLIAHEAVALLQRLRDAGVAAAAFKGIGLIANLYHGPGERMVQDVDVLVDEADRDRARAVLANMDLQPVTDRFDEYLDFLADRPHEGASSGNHSLVFRTSDGTEIDLHWRFGAAAPPGLVAARILHRAEPANLFNRVLSVAAPADAMALTVHHIVRANFAPDTTVKDLCDLRAWWRANPRRWILDDVISTADDCGLIAPLLALWRLLAQFDAGTDISAGVEALTARASAHAVRDAERLVDAFGLQLRHGRINGDLLRLLSPLALWRFVTRRLRTQSRTDYFTEQMEVDFDLPRRPTDTRRAVRLMRALIGLSPRKLAAYRALLRAHAFQRAAQR